MYEVIYQTRETVFHRDIQTPRRELKIGRAAEYFWRNSKCFYNIASRVAQSNAVYVSVLQISMVHSDCASKSLCQILFPTFSLGPEFLNEAEKENNNGKGDSASAPSRFASLFEGEMQFWQKDTLVKPNKLQTGLFHPSKVSLSFSVLKLLNMKLELSKERLK